MNTPTVINSPPDILKNSRISLHMDTCQAFVGKREINLTITEFNLLACFLENAGKALTRAALLRAVWGKSYQGTERTVDTHIQRLRSKLGNGGFTILTVRGVGYRLEK